MYEAGWMRPSRGFACESRLNRAASHVDSPGSPARIVRASVAASWRSGQMPSSIVREGRMDGPRFVGAGRGKVIGFDEGLRRSRWNEIRLGPPTLAEPCSSKRESV